MKTNLDKLREEVRKAERRIGYSKSLFKRIEIFDKTCEAILKDVKEMNECKYQISGYCEHCIEQLLKGEGK